MSQQGDVILYQTDDGGDITIENGLVEVSAGLETAAYLSLFGGNESGAEWWGNLTDEQPDYQYRSETGALLRSIPATTGNMRRIEDAVKRDLAWMSNDITAVVTMPGMNRIKLTIEIGADVVEFSENWYMKP